ncbi:NAD+ synthase [Curvibacter sp. CHRR-16]|uniref:NAD+ synthase n=1 Tax=Curvibacter sp. CHRR-16 TaxID=2835872 RepID=UPI001BDB56A2|nr:NAD+ synthase [Curvibacter sp. CHRR-16]MBT0568773.1 NAD+ synthase [Curvibacter sp. CHRR-16]
MALKLCIAQLNYTVGDVAGNTQAIAQAARQAYAQGARLVLTPELAICGYAAEDLFLRPAFAQACAEAVQQLAAQLADLSDLVLVVGHPQGHHTHGKSWSQSQRYNAASVIQGGKVLASYAKRCLPNYQVFDECRYFAPGQAVCVVDVRCGTESVRLGVLICEDLWYEHPAQETAAAGADLIVSLNASPFHVHKGQEREQLLAQRAQQTGVPIVYAHLVGGQDELIFDGQSLAVQANGALACRAPAFQPELVMLDCQASAQGWQLQGAVHTAQSDLEQLWHALVLGVRDYVGKNGFPGALLGLSGGIDSALVLAIAVDALGADKVRAVMMPSPYTADISCIDSRDMVQRLGVRYDEYSIVPQMQAFEAMLKPEFAGLPLDATEENIQARIRGTMLMALSNKFGAVVLTTGNKSEMATGYCTLYGDMAGGFAVIKDVCKTTVFALARWRNAHDPYGRCANPIPDRIITRPPSAELRPDQKDQDSLPSYDVLDAIIKRYMEENASIDDLMAEGFDPADVEKVTRLIKLNEYKRRQAPVGIRVTHRSFGKDWRYPITNRFRA